LTTRPEAGQAERNRNECGVTIVGLFDGLRNRNIRNRITNPFDEYWDRKLGIHTFGWHPGSGAPGGSDTYLPFVPSTYHDIFSYLRAAGIGPDDVFVDLGSGYGRVTFAASWMGAKRAIGVELVQTLTDGAEANRKRSVLRDRNIEFICADALAFSEPEMTMLYMFHPFGEAILEQVLKNIHSARAAASNPPKLKIVYANPVYNDAMGRAGWLRKTLDIAAPPPRPWSNAGRFAASIWESV
jgi:SAM-dependent methyltransferase